MAKNYTLFIVFILNCCLVLGIQAQKDSTKTVRFSDVEIRQVRTVNGTGHLGEVHDEMIFAGKKNEVIITDSINANKAVNNTRQIIGRIPGLNIVESETGGFSANGIGFRGLNPVQSLEVNTRQNGYNIAADIYGYNEAYYIPAMEAVERIEVVRGASSLQFGPHFGGMVNYEVKEAPLHKKFEFNSSFTTGSFGLVNAFASVGGTIKKFNYYAFGQYRYFNGWRPNSRQTQWTGFARVEYKPIEKLSLGLEYSLLRSKIQMPGGLSDDQYLADPRASFRARNWLTTPWNILALTMRYKFSENTALSVKATYNHSGRKLIWRNEDGGPAALDEIDPATGQYVPRELENEVVNSITTEIRFLTNYNLLHTKQTLAAGIRVAYSNFHRQGGGEGTTGSDYNFVLVGDKFEYDLIFTSLNIAPYFENTFRIGQKFSITPGFRFEYLNSTAKGYKMDEEIEQTTNEKRNRYIPLAGLGLEYKAVRNTNIYANFSQAYKPIDYSSLTPFGITSKIDKNMKDAYGWNADLGYRGTVKNILNFDIGGFCMQYNRRIGLILKTDSETGKQYTLRTNVANSLHVGVESYIELNLVKWLAPNSKIGSISIFNSFAYIHARYTTGDFKGNRVEYAPDFINRVGVSYAIKGFSTTFQVGNQSKAYGDATNAVGGDNPAAGIIPAYYVIDWSASYKIKMFTVKAGLNNLSDQKYFTQRTDEYPGPGIISSIGRNFYVGFSLKL
jgi:Fe(3+) dicitrate transport protein